jgi:hypothetical protein
LSVASHGISPLGAQAKRLGQVMRVSQVGIRVFQPGGEEEMLTWEP